MPAIRERNHGATCRPDIINDAGSHSWVEGGRKGGGGWRVEGEREIGPRWWRDAVEWKGVQSISHKSVCTARSPNAATLSSYSFDRDPLGLCTQSLMALFKDRNRSMSRLGGTSATRRAGTDGNARIRTRIMRSSTPRGSRKRERGKAKWESPRSAARWR